MNRKMTLFAFALKWGGFGAIGSMVWRVGGAAERASSEASSADSATAPKPLAQRRSMSRREGGVWVRLQRMAVGPGGGCRYMVAPGAARANPRRPPECEPVDARAPRIRG